MQPDPTDVEEVKAANQQFYDAFGALDIQRMEAVWETSERALCVHPGWQPLVGWDPIRASWEGIFNNATLMHFNVQYVNVVVEGSCAYVTCYEHISSVLQGRASNFGILATNIFIRTPGGWRVIAHHGTPRM
jgi:ketosteroid isomerase-like protein